MEGGVEQRRFGRGLGYHFTPFVFCLGTLFCIVGAAVNPADLSALTALSSAWGANTLGWTSGDPCVDHWHGVSCDNITNTKVVSLFLAGASIVGTIPAAIGSFSGLEILDLSFNSQLQGFIPPEIGQLTSLLDLTLQSCALTGPIPSSLGNLTNLTFLALNNNNLTGEIPHSIGRLQKVYWFDVATNNLTGLLPVSTTNADGLGLDTMATCEHLHLSNNSFTGGIPTELGASLNGSAQRLPKLKHLLLESNQLTGSVPDSIANLITLEILSLSNNQLSGPIPANLTRLATAPGSKLQQLLLAHNQFTGTIPDLTPPGALGALVLDFSYNLFDPQPFPAWPQLAPNITTLRMGKTNLVGNLSEEILSHPTLQTLWARDNNLSGTLFIPALIGPRLSAVSLRSNQFDNVLRRSSTTNVSQVEFDLLGNPVCDPDDPFRPATVCNASLGIPPWTSARGVCGPPVCSYGFTINTENNGSCNCVDPFQVVLECRRPVFSSLTDELMESLRLLLGQELGLETQQVMVASAEFTPDGRANIHINFFSVDGASLLDQASMKNITHSLTFQRLPLRGFKPYVLQWYEAGSSSVGTKNVLQPAVIAGIVASVLALVCVIGVYAIWQRRRAQRMKLMTQPFANWGGVDGEKDVAAPQMHGARWFSFSEIKKATRQFAVENEIGEGGYGKVYSGVLASGERVAVKRAQEGSMQGAEEFKNEIELLSRVHHKNLVGLVGYCYDQGEQMLVYEFMSNGTMREWLSGKKAYPLDWSKRLSIAIGSARGLAYLHEMANPPIIHRDIKSSNILLDDKHVAKVADFGLSKLAPDGADKQMETTQVKGTLGYLDPEYYMTQILSEKSDVYSFGVVLLELLTSKPPISHGRYIVPAMRAAYAEDGMEGLAPILDPSLLEASPHDLRRLLELALLCTEASGGARPAMADVVRALEALAQRNQATATASARATDETWLVDVYGDDPCVSPDPPGASSFQYSGGYTPQRPVPK